MPRDGNEDKERWLAIRTGSFWVVVSLFVTTIILGLQGRWNSGFGSRAFVATGISVAIFGLVTAFSWRMRLDSYRSERQARLKAGAEQIYSYKARIGWFTGFAATLMLAIFGAALLIGIFGSR